MQSCHRSLHNNPQPKPRNSTFKNLHPVKVAAVAGQRTWPAPQQQQLQLIQECQHRTNRRAGTTAASLGRRAMLGALAPCCCCGSCSKRNSWYDSYFAFNMAHGMQEYEDAIAPLKKALFSRLSADGSSSSSTFNLLEVGLGTGPNFAYYPAAQQQQQQQQLLITGLEPNPSMWQYAQRSAESAGLGTQQLQLVAADAQKMPFEGDTFDAAVITLVLCSLQNPSEALSEVLRVLKPGGKLLLIEHVISPSFGWLQVQQRLLDPLQQLLADSCHLTRDTAAALQQSGFEAQALQPYDVGSVAAAADMVALGRSGLLRFEVEGMGLIGPHVAGILTKPLVVA